MRVEPLLELKNLPTRYRFIFSFLFYKILFLIFVLCLPPHTSPSGLPPSAPDAKAAMRRRDWESKRLDRLLVDHLLRENQHELATRLAIEAGVEQLVDASVYAAELDVVDALRRRRDCGPALAWCARHRAKLRKLKSRLEFRLRVAEFVELVRVKRLTEAVGYARKHLSGWAETETIELQRAMACLAFRPWGEGGWYSSASSSSSSSRCPEPYARLFSNGAWDELVDLFTRESRALNSLPSDSPFVSHLQAGLSALNTAHVPRGSVNASREDPLHVAAYQRMSDALPFAKHTHSKLICHISHAIMDEDNPPMVLPNGFVYGRDAMETMAANNRGKVTCPRTGQGPWDLSELQKAFLA